MNASGETADQLVRMSLQGIEVASNVVLKAGGTTAKSLAAMLYEYNTKYPRRLNGIQESEYSIEVGVRYFSDCIKEAKPKDNYDMQKLYLSLQGYDYQKPYISWAFTNFNGYTRANANVKSESLTDTQKNNILSSVSLNSDVRILEFWITLGQKNTEEAIDIAKQLGNKEYLAYAYMKEKANVENDKSLTGSEREQKLKEIEENLKNIDINQTQESSNNE